MQNLTSGRDPGTPDHAAVIIQARPPVDDPGQALPEALGALPSSIGFAALLAAFRATGGTGRSDDVRRLLEDYGLGNFIGLARLIATGAVFGFEWRSTLWIPMFQFDLRDLSVGDGWDGWQRAVWFAEPNGRLHGRRPMEVIDTELAEILNVARADRVCAVR